MSCPPCRPTSSASSQPAEPFADGEFHWLSVLERGVDRGATAIDLVALAASGRAFTRNREGAIEAAPALRIGWRTRRNRRPLGFALGVGGGGIDFEIEVPERAVFQADTSLGAVFSENEIFGTPGRSRILVSVGSSGEMVTLADVPLGTHWSNRWTPLEADLAAWAGKRVTLRLELIRASQIMIEKFIPIGYLGSPRIVRHAEPDAPGARSDG